MLPNVLNTQMGVYNRDIKLENTLLDSSRRPLLKICDFGYSKHENDSLPISKVGTPGYTGQPFGHIIKIMASLTIKIALMRPIRLNKV